MSSHLTRGVLFTALAFGLAGGCSAGDSGETIRTRDGGDGLDASIDPGQEAGNAGLIGTMVTPQCKANCTDFPADTIMGDGVPADAPSRFTADASGAGPCITEPQDGSLFPANWLRPRVS